MSGKRTIRNSAVSSYIEPAQLPADISVLHAKLIAACAAVEVIFSFARAPRGESPPENRDPSFVGTPGHTVGREGLGVSREGTLSTRRCNRTRGTKGVASTKGGSDNSGSPKITSVPPSENTTTEYKAIPPPTFKYDPVGQTIGSEGFGGIRVVRVVDIDNDATHANMEGFHSVGRPAWAADHAFCHLIAGKRRAAVWYSNEYVRGNNLAPRVFVQGSNGVVLVCADQKNIIDWQKNRSRPYAGGLENLRFDRVIDRAELAGLLSSRDSGYQGTLCLLCADARKQ